ncbi:MAG: Gfo/Idh/MocA family oxidoreductase [Flavobacteriaceae bacterium]
MTNRRDFIKKTAAGGTALTLGSSLYPDLLFGGNLGANEQIQVAVIGVRSRAKALVRGISKYANAKITYSCDVDKVILEAHNAWCQENIGYVPKNETDFRRILEDKDVDAIFIATPEHWHAPMAIAGLQAGKHVYVEKPCSHNPAENDMLISAQKKYGKLVQMGNQQRSATTSNRAIDDIRNGVIGEVYKGEAYYSNNRASIGSGAAVEVPASLNWDLWQGPAPRMQYKDNIHPYNWHWFKNWGTGEIHNNGTHEIDICRWALGVDLPETVTSFGGKYSYADDWEFPDNMQVTYTFPHNKFITWTGHSRGLIKPVQPGRGVTIYGSKGTIELSREAYKLYGLDGRPIRFEFEQGVSATIDTMGGGDLDATHIANFFNAISKDERLNSPIADAGISTMLCHLGNLAFDAGEMIRINTNNGLILNSKKAMASWDREYEPGWEPKL